MEKFETIGNPSKTSLRTYRHGYIVNAFSLQMVDLPCQIECKEIDHLPALNDYITSAVGHADTAAVLGVPCNRVNIHLEKGDVLFIAQLQGGRLPEGSTTLPEGFSFKFIELRIR